MVAKLKLGALSVCSIEAWVSEFLQMIARRSEPEMEVGWLPVQETTSKFRGMESLVNVTSLLLPEVAWLQWFQ